MKFNFNRIRTEDNTFFVLNLEDYYKNNSKDIKKLKKYIRNRIIKDENHFRSLIKCVNGS